MHHRSKTEQFPLGAALTLADLEADPHSHLHRLRASEPVSWVPALDGWLVTSRDLVVQALRDDDGLTVDDPRFSTARIIGPSMLSTDGSEHARHRQPFIAPYRRQAVERDFERWLADEAARLVSEMRPAGSAEVRGDLAAPLAVATIIRSLDLATADDVVLGWYRSIVEAVQEITAGILEQPRADVAYAQLRAAVAETISRAPASVLGEAAARLSIEEVASNAAVLMFGAIETSEGAIANLLWHLLTNREQLLTVADDRSLIRNAVEESMRLEPAATTLDRYATRAVRLGTVTVDRGDYVVLSLAGANRDPAVFTEPDRFDVMRENAASHVAFAVGPHACLGIHLARMETAAALRAVLDALPGIQLDAARSTPPVGLVFRKPPAVQARWAT